MSAGGYGRKRALKNALPLIITRSPGEIKKKRKKHLPIFSDIMYNNTHRYYDIRQF